MNLGPNQRGKMEREGNGERKGGGREREEPRTPQRNRFLPLLAELEASKSLKAGEKKWL